LYPVDVALNAAAVDTPETIGDEVNDGTPELDPLFPKTLYAAALTAIDPAASHVFEAVFLTEILEYCPDAVIVDDGVKVTPDAPVINKFPVAVRSKTNSEFTGIACAASVGKVTVQSEAQSIK
jgi:hypothetical protein